VFIVGHGDPGDGMMTVGVDICSMMIAGIGSTMTGEMVAC
jgi:hypothetical protein